jgi:mannose-6-phosphate isomerase-like protein (cupin superfamily)
LDTRPLDIKAYISSGVLKEYVTGTLGVIEKAGVEVMCDMHPEVREALNREEELMVNAAEEQTDAPPPEFKAGMWELLHNVNKEKQMDPNDLPFINRFTDHQRWLRFVEERIPARVNEDRIVDVLQHNEKITQALVISKTDFENEEHVHEIESFIILEGECECTIGDNVFRLGPGGFTDIPLHTPHTVRIISPHVVAILQRVVI